MFLAIEFNVPVCSKINVPFISKGEKKYQCVQCDTAYVRSDHLKAHMKAHDIAKPFQCPVCPRGYTTSGALKSHVNSQHPDATQTAQPIATTTSDCSSTTCFQCLVTFSSLAILKEHLKTHEKRLATTGSVSSVNNYKCLHCHTQCTGKDALENHIRENHGSDRVNICPTCSKRCCNLDGVYIHYHKTHGKNSSKFNDKEGKLLTCQTCQRMFFNKEKYDTHVKKCEASMVGVGMYVCPYCNSRYQSEFNLYEHIEIAHTRDTVQCKYCGMRFMNKDTLKKHITLMHSSPSQQSIQPTKPTSTSDLQQFSPITVTMAQVSPLSISVPQATTARTNLPEITPAMTAAQMTTTQCSPSITSKGKHHTSATVNSTSLSNCNRNSTPSATITSPSSSWVHTDLTHSLTVQTSIDILQNHKPSSKTLTSKSSAANSSSLMVSNVVSLSQSPSDILKNNVFLCNQCDAALPDFPAFRDHQKSHLEAGSQMFYCPHCEQQFTGEEQLDSHVLTHYMSSTTEYGCQSCMKLFLKPDELQKHLMDIHAHHLYRYIYVLKTGYLTTRLSQDMPRPINNNLQKTLSLFEFRLNFI